MYKFLATVAVSLFAVSAFAQSPSPAPVMPVVAGHSAPAPHHAKKKVVHKKAKSHKKHMVKAKHAPVHKKQKHQI